MRKILVLFLILGMMSLKTFSYAQSTKNETSCLDNFEWKKIPSTVLNSGSNINDLGLYNKCINDEMSHYFLVKVQIEKYNNTLQGYLGLCLPEKCNNEASKEEIISKTANVTYLDKSNIKIFSPKNINEELVTPHLSNILTMIFIGIYLILSSGVIQFFIRKVNSTKSKSKNNQTSSSTLLMEKDNISHASFGSYISLHTVEEKNVNTDTDVESDKVNINSLRSIESMEDENSGWNIKNLNKTARIIYTTLEWFNFSKNWDIFFKASTPSNQHGNNTAKPPKSTLAQQNEGGDKELKFLNFVRVFLCFYIILLHSLVFSFDTPVRGAEAFAELAKSFWMQVIINASFVVDAFFTLSAFFLAYVGLKKFNHHESGFLFFFKGVLLRLIRIWPLIAFSFLIFWKIIFLMGDGPMYGMIMGKEVGSCEKQWPWILLLVNNWTYGIYETEAPVCFGWFWYLPNDFQLFIIGLLLIILYKKNFKIFIVAFIFCVVLSLSLEVNNLFVNRYGMDIFHQGTVLSNFLDYYILLYNRAPPFWIGLVFGILYYEYKVRNKINFFDTIKEKKYLAIIIFLLGWLLMLTMLFLPYFAYDKDVPFGISFFYNFFCRKIYSLGFILSTLAMVFGAFTPIRNIISAKIFTDLSKLSYAIYIIHPAIIKFTFYCLKYSLYLQLSYLFTYGIAFISITTAVALFFHVLFEMPFQNIK